MARGSDIVFVPFNPPGKAAVDIEVLTIQDLWQRGSETHFRRLQRADFYRLIGVQQGSTRPMIDFSHVEATAGDWLLVRPGQLLRYDFAQNWRGWLVVFRPEALFSTGRRDSRNAATLQQRLDDLHQRWRLDPQQHCWMLDSVAQLQSDGALDIDTALRNELLRLQLLGTLLRLGLWQESIQQAPLSGTEGLARLRRFRQLLDARFATEHRVQHYADALGMSEKTLSRLCVAGVGMPAKTLIDQRLALEAKRLLAHTGWSVQQIANSLGFSEATNFCKFFRRVVGVTPRAFREAEQR